jgi:uncharacterized protein YceK
MIQKQALIIGIISLIFCLGLSGCSTVNTNNNSSNTTNNPTFNGTLQLVNYTVVTQWKEHQQNGTINETQSGFYHNIPTNVDFWDTHYIINGEVRNNKDTTVDRITVRMLFYDKSNHEVYGTEAEVANVASGQEKNFSVDIQKGTVSQGITIPTFDIFDHVNITIS